jgi:hypothetical protein
MGVRKDETQVIDARDRRSGEGDAWLPEQSLRRVTHRSYPRYQWIPADNDLPGFGAVLPCKLNAGLAASDDQCRRPVSALGKDGIADGVIRHQNEVHTEDAGGKGGYWLFAIGCRD